jgi:hypothetical protein
MPIEYIEEIIKDIKKYKEQQIWFTFLDNMILISK